jgi:hypothetical protein
MLDEMDRQAGMLLPLRKVMTYTAAARSMLDEMDRQAGMLLPLRTLLKQSVVWLAQIARLA